MKIFIGLDDTDTVDSKTGTGHLARMIMDDLASRELAAYAVSRHQLLFDPRIPYTAKNSANVVHVLGDVRDISAVAKPVEEMVIANFQPGSDPGICIAAAMPEAIIEFGRRAKKEIVTQEEAMMLAQEHSVLLRGLGGTNAGIIGALAGVGLAACGNDGRFTRIGRARELTGLVPVIDVLNAGVSEVRTLAGDPVSEGHIQTGDKLRPALREGRAVLYVERVNGCWQALRLD